MRSSLMLSKLFSKVWNNLKVLELPYITDVIALQMASACPSLQSFSSEMCYNFSIPETLENAIEGQGGITTDGEIGDFILTNNGFIADSVILQLDRIQIRNVFNNSQPFT